jgi:hypothetical protein
MTYWRINRLQITKKCAEGIKGGKQQSGNRWFKGGFVERILLKFCALMKKKLNEIG